MNQVQMPHPPPCAQTDTRVQDRNAAAEEKRHQKREAGGEWNPTLKEPYEGYNEEEQTANRLLPIHHAARRGNLHAIQHALQHGVDVNARAGGACSNLDGFTPISESSSMLLPTSVFAVR